MRIIIKHILYSFINLFVSHSKQIKKNSVLLVRLDAIGDYVMFRNFIEILKTSERYKNCHVTLLGNNAWKELSAELDKQHIDKFIWLDKNKFSNNLIYRYKKLMEISAIGYELILNPMYSREFFISDTIVKCVNAKNKVGSTGDLSNTKKWQKKISDQYYTKLIPANNELKFEFERNREFFSQLLGYPLSDVTLSITLKPKSLTFHLPKRYAVIFLGASAPFRKWSANNFAQIAVRLKQQYKLEIVLCGALSDSSDAKQFMSAAPGGCTDLVGKTTLVDLLYVLKGAVMLLSNETSAPHMAVALNVANTFVVSNGNHFGRFIPYPQHLCKNYHVTYHPEIALQLDSYALLCQKYGFGSQLDINDITVESVYSTLQQQPL